MSGRSVGMNATKEKRNKTKKKGTVTLAKATTASSGQFSPASRPAMARVPVRGARQQPYARAEIVRRKVGFTQQEYADFLGIDPRTYTRRAEEEQLKSGESLQVEMVDKVLEEATRVFRDEELARKWLRSPIISLGNKRPIDHLDSIEGYERVKDTLGKIEYGMH